MMNRDDQPSSNSDRKHGSATSNGVDCEQLRELIPAYSIGATDPDETRLVEAMLQDCPKAAADLSDYLVLADEFVYLVPESRENRREADDMLMPKLSSVAAMRQAEGRTSRTAAAKPRPAAAAARPMPAPRRSWALTAATLAAGLLLVLLTASNLYWFREMQQIAQEQRALTARLEEVQLAMLPAADLPINAALVQHRELLPNLDTDVSSAAHATLFWDTSDELGSLYVSGLPTLTPDKTYQLWLVRDGHSLSLGKFRVDEAGAATLVFESPERIEDFQHIGVSEEPAAGSLAPTTPHLVIGNI